MNKKRYRIPALLLIWLLGAVFCPLSALASQTCVEAAVPVSLRITGEPKAEEYCFLLTPRDNAPMPETGQTQCRVQCTEKGTVRFPAIPFYAPGVYHYTISQIPGTHSDVQYDERVYDAAITVSNAESSEELAASMSIRCGGEKYESAEFVNVCASQMTYQTVYVRKLWVDRGQNRPDSVTVQLLSDGAVLGTATLSDSNHWSYCWESLVESGKEWQVQETPVPKGYEVSYHYTDDTVTITNRLAPRLIQTGQLVWPIWVLGGAGMVLVVWGIVKRKKNNA